jgi:hypothetical protein
VLFLADERIEHFIRNGLDLVAFLLVNEPGQHILFNLQIA